MNDRALESDPAARTATDKELVTLWKLRQSALIRTTDERAVVIKAARDSAEREILWRMSGGKP